MKKILLLAVWILMMQHGNAQTNRYRLVVKFGSMCCGVPSNEPLLKYVAAFKKKHKIKKVSYYKVGPLGKEGEYDMAFTLTELKKAQVASFVKEITALAKTMKEQGYTSVEENVEIDKALLGRATMERKTL